MDLISRQAAMKAADSIIERDTSGNNDVAKAMTAWKEYIKALPPTQPSATDTNVGGNLIDRQAAIDALDKRFDKIPMEQTAEILSVIGISARTAERI